MLFSKYLALFARFQQQAHQKASAFNHVPTDLIQNTFPFLESKDLANLSVSCREMNDLIMKHFERDAVKLGKDLGLNFEANDESFLRELIVLSKIKMFLDEQNSKISKSDVLNAVNSLGTTETLETLTRRRLYRSLSFLTGPKQVLVDKYLKTIFKPTPFCFCELYDRFTSLHLPRTALTVLKSIPEKRNMMLRRYIVKKALYHPKKYVEIFKYLCREVYKIKRNFLISRLKRDYILDEYDLIVIKKYTDSVRYWLVINPYRFLSFFIYCIFVFFIGITDALSLINISRSYSHPVLFSLYLALVYQKLNNWFYDFENFNE